MKSKQSREKIAKQLRTSGERRHLNTGSTARKRARKKIRSHYSTDADEYRETLAIVIAAHIIKYCQSESIGILECEYERVRV